MPVKPEVRRGPQGEVTVRIPAFDASRGLKQPASLKPHRIRLRLMLIAFHFHDEYFEHVDVKDTEFSTLREVEATDIVLEGTVPAGAILMLGMSVVLLREDRIRLREFTPINSREYSPAAILCAWQPAEEVTMGQKAALKEYSRLNDAGHQRNFRLIAYCGDTLIANVDYQVKRYVRKGTLKAEKQVVAGSADETEQLKGKRVAIPSRHDST